MINIGDNMNLEEFVSKCKSGEIKVVKGKRKEGILVEELIPIPINPEAIAEEAYKRNLFPDKTSWKEALGRVNDILKTTSTAEPD